MPGGSSFLKFKSRLLLLPLLAVLLVAYQNCAGNLAAVSSGRWTSIGATPRNQYLDGLPAGITQAGKIYRRDPGSAVGSPGLAFDADLTASQSSADIKHLLNLSYLSNGYIHFQNDSTYPAQIATPQGPLEFAAGTPRFRQVNSYFQIDQLIADLAGMSMFPSSYSSTQVDAHCVNTDSQNNAYYSFEDHELCLGYSDVLTSSGTKRIWAADDEDVTIHEFGHSLNHTYSTTEVLTSTSDLGAIDEGFADLWTYRQTLDQKIAVWFGRAIYKSMGYNVSFLRNLASVKVYPTALVDEVHDDAIFISGAVAQIQSAAGLNTEGRTRLLKRMLDSLQVGHGLQDAVVALQDESDDLLIDPSIVSSALSARGLLRRDAVSELILNSTKNAYVIDNHEYPSFQVNGNCNAALDAGESVLLYANLENTGSLKGGVRVELATTTPTRAVVETGGEFGFFYRMKATSTFVAGELASYNRSVPSQKSAYKARLAGPSFAVSVPPGATAGNAHFVLTVTSMDTIDGTPESKTIEFDLPVGVAANAASCATDVFP